MSLGIDRSFLVISDLDRFIGMKDFWDQELRDRVNNPFVFSDMLIEHWRMGLAFGFLPFLLIFLSKGKIIGFAPLVMKSKFGFRQVFNLHQYFYPEFFSNDYREVCFREMIDFLLVRLNCASVDLTFEEDSADQKVFERVCESKKLYFFKSFKESQAIVFVNSSLEDFQNSLGRNTRKGLRKINRKISEIGSWKVHEISLNRDSIKKIWSVEKYSWKNKLTGKDKIKKDTDLKSVLEAIQKKDMTTLFTSKVWFLELNNIPIVYQLVLSRNKTAFFIKTSFDSRYAMLSPGKFLINNLIEQAFKGQNPEKIDFITNMPLCKTWKPVVKSRIAIRIEKKLIETRIRNLLFKNRIITGLFNRLAKTKVG